MILRFASAPRTAEPGDPFERDASLARLEAVLWMAEGPIASKKLADVLGFADGRDARHHIERLQHLYEAGGTPYQIAEIAGGYQLLTRPTYQPWLLRLGRTGHEARLTPTAMEVLAVIAYEQPVTRADVEAIRGVSCVEMIRLLLEKGLVRTSGRHDSLGRPTLYATTKKFLQMFGLNNLDDLPEVEALKKPG